MIVYRVSIAVESAAAPGWLTWMRKQHIPAVLKTGCFDHAYMLRPLPPAEGAHQHYTIEYTTTSIARVGHYQRQFANALEEDHRLKFHDRVRAAYEVLEVMK